MKKTCTNWHKVRKAFAKRTISKDSLCSAFQYACSYIWSRSGSENTSISGKIMDKQGTLPGVSILEKGTSNGTRSDGNGKFTLTLSSDAKILIISHVGYLTKEVDAKQIFG
jgi:hypothetical protein